MIVYFSGTGNSRYVAKSLAEQGEEIVDVMLCEKAVIDGGRLGIIYPCYCGDLPPKMYDFLSKSEFSAAPEYTFAVATCGLNGGQSFSSVAYVLEEKGGRLDYAEKIVMPDSCILYAMKPDRVKKLLDTQDERIQKIGEEIAVKAVKKVKKKKPFGASARTVWAAFGNVVGIYRKSSTDQCVGCGKCVKVCKANNVRIVDGKAVFGKDEKTCFQCFACINVCDRNAVRFGTLKATDEKRYIHPSYGETEE